MSRLFQVFLILTTSVILFACGSPSYKEADMVYENQRSESEYSPEEMMGQKSYTYDEEIPAVMQDFQSVEMQESRRADYSASRKTQQNPDLSAILYASETGVTDTMRNLLRTANLKFRVKDIVRATLTIEDIVSSHGGYIENTQLRSVVDRRYSVQTSKDSLLCTNYCTATNGIVIRIPNKNFNATLKAFVPVVDYLDHRDISNNNITIDLIARQLAEKRAFMQGQRLKKAVDNKPAKLENVVDAENTIAYRQEQEDNAKIERLRMRDKIDFSTIYLHIYQNDIVDVKTVAVVQTKDTYKPSFGSRLLGAFKSGWQILEDILLFIVDIWAIILLIVLVLAWIRRYYVKVRRKNDTTQ